MHNRFFCPAQNIDNKRILITDRKEIHHIVDVLRLTQGSKIIIFDGTGREFEGIIKDISKGKLEVAVEKKSEMKKKAFSITLACALPKNSKFDFIVEKTTELGIDRIIPLNTDKTEVFLTKERMLSRVHHWRKIAISASKQSQRRFVPEIDELKSFKEAVSEAKNYDLAIFPTLQGKRSDILAVLNSFEGKNVIVFIGPEGDFTKEEIKFAQCHGCRLVALGPNVLKVDTAAIFTVAILSCILK